MERTERHADAWLAPLWGFAEATLFFIVPDVLLSFLALDSRRRALIGCIWVVTGAVVGGAAMYAWGARDRDQATAALERVPAVDRAMIDRVEREMEETGFVAVFVGAFTGTPYKLFATSAGSLRMGLIPFLAVSIPARLVRFVLVSWLVGGISRFVGERWDPGRKRAALAIFWIVFYTAFFILMSS